MASRFEVLFCGTGAADYDWSRYGERGVRGSCSTLLDGRVLLDCGPTGFRALARLGVDPRRLREVWFTHSHADHCSSALAGGPYLKDLGEPGPDGNKRMHRLVYFVFVINPEFFMGLDTFKKTAGGICRGLRASTKAPGAERIYTAGEKEWLAWQERKDKGVPVGESIQKEFVALRDRFGLPYRFPFEG